jgi:hypothetical protein
MYKLDLAVTSDFFPFQFFSRSSWVPTGEYNNQQYQVGPSMHSLLQLVAD